METTTFFDSWLNTQNKMINNWVSTTHKMQDAITGGKVMEKGSDIYNEWLKNQMDLVKSTVATTTEEGAAAGTDFFSSWMKTQQDNTKKWMEYNQNMMKNFMPSGDQNQAFEAMRKNWTDTYNNWMNNWSAPFAKMMENMPGNASKDAFGNILNTTNSYFKMYEVWMPMYKAMTEKSFDPSKFNEFFSADKFKEVMDNTFKFVYPSPVKDAFENAANWFEMFNNFSKQFAGQYMNQYQNMPKMPAMMFGDNEAMLNAYNNMTNMYQKSIFPIFRITAPGKESELAETYINTVDKYAVYATKLNELQYIMYVTGQKAMEDLTTETYAQISNGSEVPAYGDFFQKWVEGSEKAYLDLFKTDEYSKLQGELVDLGVEIKTGFEKLMESVFSQYPVVLRSEADELHKTIYELKKRVRELEKQQPAENEEPKAAKKPAAKSSK